MSIYHIPTNEKEMDELYVVLSKDQNGEGIVATVSPIGNMPLVFGQERLLEKTKSLCKNISKETKKTIRIYKFKKSDLVAEFTEGN